MTSTSTPIHPNIPTDYVQIKNITNTNLMFPFEFVGISRSATISEYSSFLRVLKELKRDEFVVLPKMIFTNFFIWYVQLKREYTDFLSRVIGDEIDKMIALGNIQFKNTFDGLFVDPYGYPTMYATATWLANTKAKQTDEMYMQVYLNGFADILQELEKTN